MKTRNNRQVVADETLIEKPLVFTLEFTTEKKGFFTRKVKRVIRKKKYTLYPPTTGKIKAISSVLGRININEEALKNEPLKEGLKIAEENADLVSKVIAIALRNTKEEILDEEGIERDAEFIKWNARPESMASLLLIAITQSDYQSLVSVILLSQKIWNLKEGTEKKGIKK